jgi:hypothetical protein
VLKTLPRFMVSTGSSTIFPCNNSVGARMFDFYERTREVQKLGIRREL